VGIGDVHEKKEAMQSVLFALCLFRESSSKEKKQKFVVQSLLRNFAGSFITKMSDAHSW
jgi:hypothetical protein